MNIKFIIIVALIVSMISSSCRKNNYMSDAVITGEDYRLCVCCGGLFIKLNDGRLFLTGSLENFGVKDNEKFPISVRIDWQTDSSHWYGNYIMITRLMRLA